MCLLTIKSSLPPSIVHATFRRCLSSKCSRISWQRRNPNQSCSTCKKFHSLMFLEETMVKSQVVLPRTMFVRCTLCMLSSLHWRHGVLLQKKLLGRARSARCIPTQIPSLHVLCNVQIFNTLQNLNGKIQRITWERISTPEDVLVYRRGLENINATNFTKSKWSTCSKLKTQRRGQVKNPQTLTPFLKCSVTSQCPF